MTGYPGYYSLIQYCPDLSRAEAANVGVVLFCPSLRFIQARTSSGNDRIRRFFRGLDFDRDRLNHVKQSIERRLRVDASSFQSLADLEGFIDTRANEIQLTSPRPMKVADPRADLDQLFKDLVGGRKHGEAVRPEIRELDDAFARLHREGRALQKQHVRVPVLGTTLSAPYAYRNGALNLVKPLAFSSRLEGEARRRAGHLALEGDLLAKYPDDGVSRRLVVVSGGRGQEVGNREQEFAKLFEEYRVKFVSRGGISAFLREVEREAHA